MTILSISVIRRDPARANAIGLIAGSPGRDGTNGLNGKDGAPGRDGTDGVSPDVSGKLDIVSGTYAVDGISALRTVLVPNYAKQVQTRGYYTTTGNFGSASSRQPSCSNGRSRLVRD